MGTATTVTAPAISAKVQHVTKKSSDELLRKFAEMDSDADARKKKDLRFGKRRKKGGGRGMTRDDGESTAVAERRSLLLPVPAEIRRSALLRLLGIGRAKFRATRDVRNKSLLGTIEKTWRRTVGGASRVFIEKHYLRHKRLINDIVLDPYV